MDRSKGFFDWYGDRRNEISPYALALVLAFAYLLGGCADYDSSRREVADQVAQELALSVEEPLRDLMEADSDAASVDAHEAIGAAIEEALHGLESRVGVSRFEPAGRFSGHTPNRSAARASMAAVVVPSDEREERYCILAAIHSDGRVEAAVTAVDPANACGDADLQEFGRSP